jgi:hypothetical protein
MSWRLEVSTWTLNPIRFAGRRIGKQFDTSAGFC